MQNFAIKHANFSNSWLSLSHGKNPKSKFTDLGLLGAVCLDAGARNALYPLWLVAKRGNRVQDIGLRKRDSNYVLAGETGARRGKITSEHGAPRLLVKRYERLPPRQQFGTKAA